MLLRCLQAFVALVFLAFLAGVPTESYAHEAAGHVSTHASSENVGGQVTAPAQAQFLSASHGSSDENSHHPGCVSCCACSGGACQGAATLPAFADYLAPFIALPAAPYDALSPPRRARTSLEHPPKSFA